MACRASPADVDAEDEDEEETRMRLQARCAAVQCLSAAEAVSMIESLRINEAAHVVMSMPAEKRCAVLLALEDDRRAAVIAAMPAEMAVVVMNELSSSSQTPENPQANLLDEQEAEMRDASQASTAEVQEQKAELRDASQASSAEVHHELASSEIAAASATATAESAHSGGEVGSESEKLAEQEEVLPSCTKGNSESLLAEDTDHLSEAVPGHTPDLADSTCDEARCSADADATGHEEGGTQFQPPPRVFGAESEDVCPASANSSCVATSEQADFFENPIEHEEEDAELEAAEDPTETQREVQESEADEVVLESFSPIGSHVHCPRAVVREGSCMDSLSTQEAAQLLVRVPPLEAARLALSMDEEERMAALAYMPANSRKAVLAALPYNVRLTAGLMDLEIEDHVEKYDEDSDEDLPMDDESDTAGSGPVLGTRRQVSYLDDDESKTSGVSSSRDRKSVV